MTFAVFEDLRLWADTLQQYLVCTSFFASLCSAAKSGNSQLYLPRLPTVKKIRSDVESTECTQASSIASISISASSTCYSYLSSILLRVIHHNHYKNSEGFLHVTADRLLFVTICRGRRPALLAGWSFINGEIGVFGTGRFSVTSENVASNMFYLIGAAGSYIFTCDKATELCRWIQNATRPASYLYERRWLSSVAAQLVEDQAILPIPQNGDSVRKVYGPSLSDVFQVHRRGLQQMPCFPLRECSNSLSTIHLQQMWERGSNQSHVCLPSHPANRPVLSVGQPKEGQRHDGCVLHHSHSNASAFHCTCSRHPLHISSECCCCCCRQCPSSADSTDETSLNPTAASSRLTDTWSTFPTRSPGLLSVSRFPQDTAPCVPAASECRNRISDPVQLERQQSRLVGVTCSVPWDAAATDEKPRTGRLYFSREDIRKASFKATSTIHPSSLSSAECSSYSSSSNQMNNTHHNEEPSSPSSSPNDNDGFLRL